MFCFGTVQCVFFEPIWVDKNWKFEMDDYDLLEFLNKTNLHNS